MKRRKKIIIIMAIILIFIGLLVVFIGHKLLNKEKYHHEKIYFTPDEIIELLSYVPNSIINTEFYNDAYYGEVVTSDDILPMILSPSLIGEYYDNYALKVDENSKIKELLDKSNIKFAGIFKTYDLEEYLMKRYYLKLKFLRDITDKIRIVKLGEGFSAIIQNDNSNFSILYKILISVDDAYAINEIGIITERVLFYEFKDNKYYVYKNSNIYDEKNIIKTYNAKDESGVELNANDIFNQIKEDFKSYNNVQFKHTYKKNGAGYYYYSTEMEEVKKSRQSWFFSYK